MRQLEEVGDVEGRSPRGHDDEVVGSHEIGPLGRQGDQLTGGVDDVRTIGAPVLAALDELELLTRPRVKRMRDPDPILISQILGFGCS